MKDRFDGVVDQLLTAGIFLEQAVEVLEKTMIQGALDRNKHNQSAAARTLGIHRNTLQRKMVEFALGAPRQRPRRKPPVRAGKTKPTKTGIA
jgi:DNA-binding NtrC family response regulator